MKLHYPGKYSFDLQPALIFLVLFSELSLQLINVFRSKSTLFGLIKIFNRYFIKSAALFITFSYLHFISDQENIIFAFFAFKMDTRLDRINISEQYLCRILQLVFGDQFASLIRIKLDPRQYLRRIPTEIIDLLD
jgi:hypothetical protein